MTNFIPSFARTIIERSTRNWIFKRRLPNSFGNIAIYVSPEGGLKYLIRPMKLIDPALLRNAIDLIRPNDVVWDIGANIGLFTFAAAARAGHNGTVIALEPDTWLVALLRKSAAIQPMTSAPVTIVAAAIASDLSLRKFTISSRLRASNTLFDYGRSQIGGTRETQTVVTLTLDWLAEKLPHPNVIKCDVEGAEVEVFSNQSILRNSRPVIICEIGAETSEKMTSILVKERYRLYDGDKPLSPNAEIGAASWNTVAIPEESVGRYLDANRR